VQAKTAFVVAARALLLLKIIAHNDASKNAAVFIVSPCLRGSAIVLASLCPVNVSTLPVLTLITWQLFW
jgi:hypothetical protein